MTGLVSGALENPEKDEPGADGGVKNSKEDQGRDHEGERYFLVNIVAKRTESWCSHVLITSEAINDSAHNAEDNNLANCDSPKSLGEISRVLHLSNKTGKSDLTNEGVADVEESIHP